MLLLIWSDLGVDHQPLDGRDWLVNLQQLVACLSALAVLGSTKDLGGKVFLAIRERESNALKIDGVVPALNVLDLRVANLNELFWENNLKCRDTVSSRIGFRPVIQFEKLLSVQRNLPGVG